MGAKEIGRSWRVNYIEQTVTDYRGGEWQTYFHLNPAIAELILVRHERNWSIRGSFNFVQKWKMSFVGGTFVINNIIF